MSFTTIKNGVDTRLFIIRHDESGFYNITKTARLVTDLKNSSLENPPSELINAPRINNWFRTKDTIELLDVLAKYLDENVEDLKFDITNGENEYRGTYVHPKVYDHFVAWVDKEYAVLISLILEKHHADANRVKLQEKDDQLQALREEVKKQTSLLHTAIGKIDDVSDQNHELKSEVQDAHGTILVLNDKVDDQTNVIHGLTDKVDELTDKVDDLTEDVRVVAGHATVPPSRPAEGQAFAITLVSVASDDGIKFNCQSRKSTLGRLDRTLENVTTGNFVPNRHTREGQHIVILKVDQFADGASLFSKVKSTEYEALYQRLKAHNAKRLIELTGHLKTAMDNAKSKIKYKNTKRIPTLLLKKQTPKVVQDLKDERAEVVRYQQIYDEASSERVKIMRENGLVDTLWKYMLGVEWKQASFEYTLNSRVSLTNILDLFLARIIRTRAGISENEKLSLDELSEKASGRRAAYLASADYESIDVADQTQVQEYVSATLGKYYRGITIDDVELVNA